MLDSWKCIGERPWALGKNWKRCFYHRIFLASNLFSLFQERWRRTWVCPASRYWTNRTLMMGEFWQQMMFWRLKVDTRQIQTSEKMHIFDLHWWQLLQPSSAARPTHSYQEANLCTAKSPSPSDEGRAEMGAVPTVWLTEGKAKDETAMQRHCRSIQGCEDWVMYPDWCVWHLPGSYLPSLVTDFSPSFFEHSKSVSGRKIQQKNHECSWTDWGIFFPFTYELPKSHCLSKQEKLLMFRQ